MKQNEMKLYFETGALDNPVITHTMLSEKWQLMADITERKEGKKPQKRTEILESKRGNTREFSTIEAAIKLLDEIGLKQVNVSFK